MSAISEPAVRNRWRALRRGTCAAGALLISLGLPPPVEACSCAGTTDPPIGAARTEAVRRAYTTAHAIFLGEVVSRNTLTLRFDVETVWKGEIGPELSMSTGAVANRDGTLTVNTGDLSDFEVGKRYRVFAYGFSLQTMKAARCSETREFVDAGETMGHLDIIARARTPSAAVAAVKSVVVMGFVRKPGVVAWTPGMTVADAIELAGGLSSFEYPATHPDKMLLDRVTSASALRRATVMAKRESPALDTRLLCDDEIFVGRDLRR